MNANRLALHLDQLETLVLDARALLLKHSVEIGSDTERAACRMTMARQAIEAARREITC